MSKDQRLAMFGGQAAVIHPPPHFVWGHPSTSQRKALEHYISQHGAMSIYGDEGIYRILEDRIETIYNANYCILTNTGTSALNSAYVGIGLGLGDEVIVPTYTFLATVTPLLRLGAIPIFADSDPHTGNIDPTDVENKITDKTKAVSITHMWGAPCEMLEIVRIAKAFNLKLVEDCSHAHLTRYQGQLCGSFGDVACFSIGAKKTWTSGEGGFLITNDPEIYVRATLLGHFDKRARQAITRIHDDGFSQIAEKYRTMTIGFGENYRMHPYSAVMALAFLENDLDGVIQKRGESLQYFSSRLAEIDGISPPQVSKDFYSGAMYGYKAQIDRAKIGYRAPLERLIDALQRENVQIKLPDSGMLHNDPIFRRRSDISLENEPHPMAMERFPGASAYLKDRVSLPTFSGGVEVDRLIIDQYCDALHKVLSQADLLNYPEFGH
jgi:dTDP-4-amino-4,6-dideoxygalactose transaminase